MDTKRVLIWSASRSISTALLRSLMALKSYKHKVLMEPFAAAFYSGPQKQSSRTIGEAATRPTATYESTAKTLMEEYPGCDLVVSKDFAFYVENYFHLFSDEGLRDYKHTFIIRDPRKAVPSFYKVSITPGQKGWDYFEPNETGYKQLHELYTFIANNVDATPVVIDADDLLANPDEIMRLYCEAVGLRYEENMTKWEPGILPAMEPWIEAWGTSWFETLITSSGFIKSGSAKPKKDPYSKEEGNSKEIPSIVLETAEWCIPFYDALYQKRLRSSASPSS